MVTVKKNESANWRRGGPETLPRPLNPPLATMSVMAIAAALAAVGEEAADVPPGFMRAAWPAYFAALPTGTYWCSCEEILWAAECARYRDIRKE